MRGGRRRRRRIDGVRKGRKEGEGEGKHNLYIPRVIMYLAGCSSPGLVSLLQSLTSRRDRLYTTSSSP